MYGATFYIEPRDILNKLSEEDRKRFNQCVFSDVTKARDGSLEIYCVFFNDQDVDEKSQYRYNYFSEGEIMLDH